METDPWAGWTFSQTPHGFYYKAPNGYDRFMSNEEAADWAVKVIADNAAGKIEGEHNVELVLRVLGPEAFRQALGISAQVAEIAAEEYERLAALAS